MGLHRVGDWGEFKRLFQALRPDYICYAIEDNPLGSPPIALRLVFASKGETYVFVDFARGDRLIKTGIQVREVRGQPYVAHEDIAAFVKRELGPEVSVVDFTLTTFL
ncbi:MAG TPA: hypothetical protein ENF78_00640 [Candidatus Bathyarchaeota archaeon]|nr:hypothetical protein [Candidatus Bathyarchaeota archaeon]